jgi:hypothetical protein
MEDDLNIFESGRRPQLFCKGRRPHFFLKENNLKKIMQPKTIKVKTIIFLKKEDNLKKI